MSDNNRISEWMRIDLHIHTDKSRETKTGDYQGNFDVGTLKTKLTENKVRIFSLTDHNIINVQAYKDYIRDYEMGDPFPLLGVELDVDHINGERYHALIIFKTDVTQDTNIIDTLNGLLNSLYIGKTNQERVTTFAELMKNFHRYEFMFILHGEGDKSIWEAIKRNISDTVEVTNFVIAYENLGLEKVKEESIEIWNNNFDKSMTTGLSADDYIPYMSFSDNHNIEQYPRIHKADTNDKGVHSFTYIKGIPNYESLRLAFVDPTIRIKSDAEVKAIKTDIESRGYIKELKLENVKLTDNDGLKTTNVQDVVLTLSPHFNAIIGGSSSGKSLLSVIIGRKISSLQSSDKLNDKYKLDTGKHPQVKFYREADWRDVVDIENDRIVYLAQGEIIDYFYKGNMKKFAENSNKAEEYEIAKKSFIEKKETIQTLANEIAQIYERVNIVKGQISACKILDSDIILKLGDDWSFTTINFELEDPKHLHKTPNLDAIISELEKFKSSWDLEPEELLDVQKFEKILLRRKDIITNESKLRAKQNLFIYSIPQVITTANSTAIARNLSTQATARNDAIAKIDEIKQSAADIFSQFLELKKIAIRARETNLSHKNCFQINEEVDIGLESNCEINTLEKLIIDEVITEHNKDNLYDAMHARNRIKRPGSNPAFSDKINRVLKSECFSKLEKQIDFLVYKKQGGTESKNNSPGRNCEYYLKTIFSNDNIKTIIIDQPEDNLGTMFISENDGLIETIRKCKMTKQIFLVTHNASVVVYGDAENTILAKNNGTTITYEQIRMEDGEDEMKKICDNLDGGEKVFENRRRKYNIKKMK